MQHTYLFRKFYPQADEMGHNSLIDVIIYSKSRALASTSFSK